MSVRWQSSGPNRSSSSWLYESGWSQNHSKACSYGCYRYDFESRPNVSIDAFSLAFKTNNAIILRGGRDAINSNKALVTVAREALENAGITADAVQLVEDTSHEVAEELMAATKYVDLLIPRGGARLIQTVKEKPRFQSLKRVLVTVIFMWINMLT